MLVVFDSAVALAPLDGEFMRGIMRRCCVLAICFLPACAFFPMTLMGPGDTPAIIGGIVDQRPFFGQLGSPIPADGSQFVMATCGCGEWKAFLVASKDAEPVELDLGFYATGEYVPTGSVTVYGEEHGNGVSGVIDQDTGAANGMVQLGTIFMNFSAQRGDNHDDQVNACTLCHVGDKPIFPLDATHPSYATSPANCLDCHEVVITK